MKQIFEIDCESERISAEFLRKYLKGHFDHCAALSVYAVRNLDIKVKEITDRPVTVTVDVNGKEFKQAVRKIADEVRVKASEEYYAKMLGETLGWIPTEEKICDECANFQASENLDRKGLAERHYSFPDGIGGGKVEICFVHKTAIIDGGVVIGRGTKIWHHSHICKEARIGKNCTIGDNVYIGKEVYIGNNCKIQNNAYIPEGVIINDNVFIGPCATFTNIKYPNATISQKDKFKQTFVRNNATIGANATILCGIEIGAHSMIGAGSVVTKPVIAYTVAVGNPAKLMRIISKEQ